MVGHVEVKADGVGVGGEVGVQVVDEVGAGGAVEVGEVEGGERVEVGDVGVHEVHEQGEVLQAEGVLGEQQLAEVEVEEEGAVVGRLVGVVGVAQEEGGRKRVGARRRLWNVKVLADEVAGVEAS